MINTTGCHVNHNSSRTRDSASQEIPSFLYKRRQGCKWRFWPKKRWSYPSFSLPLSVVLTHAYLVHLIRYQTFIKNFSPTAMIPILISFQTSASTLFGERQAFNILQCQWLGFHDSSYRWGGVTSEVSSDLNNIHLKNKKFSFSFKSLLKRLPDCFYSQTSATFWPKCKVSEEKGFRKQVKIFPCYYN